MKISNNLKNKEFWCDKFMRFTNYNRCMMICGNLDKETCAISKFTNNTGSQTMFDKVYETKKEECPRCGDYLVDGFCQTCGFPLDDDGEF